VSLTVTEGQEVSYSAWHGFYQFVAVFFDLLCRYHTDHGLYYLVHGGAMQVL